MSQHLFLELPDSLQPRNRSQLKISELHKILRNTFDIKGWCRVEYDETDSLCLLFAPKYVEINNESERRNFLFQICKYFQKGINFHRGKSSSRGVGSSYEYPYSKIGMKYCDLYLNLYKSKLTRDQEALSNVLLFKSFFYLEQNAFKEAHGTLQLALISAKKSESDLRIIQTYNALASFFERLDLPNQSLVYCDSAYWAQKNVNLNVSTQSRYAYTISLKQIANFSLYAKTFSPKYSDSIISLHQIAKVTPNGTFHRGRLLAYSYVLISGLAYYRGDFAGALANIDSAYHAFSNLRLIDGWEMALVFKGLSLQKLGRISESAEVLRQLDLNDVHRPIVGLVLEELYKKEQARGNYAPALAHHEQLLRFQQQKHQLDMEGKALEMEQFYNVRQRDQHIIQLTELHRRNQIIAVFIITSISLVVVILTIRYRATLVRTEQLVSQIDEATQLQVLHLESARREERKILGQDLHDGLSSAIAGIRHRLEIVIMDAKDPDTKKELETINNLVTGAYDVSRAKSHSLFNDSKELHEQAFAAQIQTLADSSLPNSHYTKEISIDDYALANVSTEARINMLRIIQESLTNVVKHAKATNISILIYEDLSEVILTIKDDGKGIKSEKKINGKTGMGLASIRERVKKMNGKLSINSDKDGTEIFVSFPILKS